MSKAALAVEGFIANELSVRDAGGHRVVDISVPHTPRKFDDQSKEWVDAGETTWFRASFWDEHADVVLQSIEKGSLVTLTGSIKVETYEKNAGGTGVNVTVTQPVLAAVVRRPKQDRGGKQQDNAWAAQTPPAADGAMSQPGSYTDETPF